MNAVSPTVSVCMITYNQEKFIGQAIDSVLSQKTDFEVEIVIGEDCSTDATRNICLAYRNRFPGKIRLRLPDKNQGMIPNFVATINSCKGKYVAICEGDDYWTDQAKLQRQVEFLDANAEFSACFHNATVEYDDGSSAHPFNQDNQKDVLCIDDIIGQWQIATASLLFRNNIIQLPAWFEEIHNGDYALELLLAGKGPIGYLPEAMSVYRKHATGLSAATAGYKYFYTERLIDLFQRLAGYYKGTSAEAAVSKKIRSLQRNLLLQKVSPGKGYYVALKRLMGWK